MNIQDFAADLAAFDRAIANDTGHDAPWIALETLVRKVIGAKLFTTMTVDMKNEVARRAYTSDPVSYPSSGTKPIRYDSWFDIVHKERRSFVANTIEDIAKEFDTNFYGKLLMARAFAPVIENNGGGAIVNLLTVVALASMPGIAAYNASKAAAWSMTQSLRGSLAGKDIAVVSVFPGPVDTDMAASIPVAKTPAAEVARAIVNGIAAGQEDIFPDPMSASVCETWRTDHKAIERQFAAM